MKRFTIIELLVVIVIIAILATILLPSLKKARAKTMMAVCLSNQKQISLALLNYTIDESSSFPTMHNEAGEYGRGWSFDDQLSGYDGRDFLSVIDKNQWGFALDHEQKDTTAMYRCPADNRGSQSNLSRIARSYSLSTLYSQPSWGARGITNNAWITDVDDMESLKFTQIGSPSQSIILVDNQHQNNSVGHLSAATVTAQDVRNQRANGAYWSHELWKTNFLFADGSARYMTFDHTYSPTNKNAWASADVRETLWDCLK